MSEIMHKEYLVIIVEIAQLTKVHKQYILMFISFTQVLKANKT